MQTLADLQRRFCDALRSPETPPEGLLAELIDDGHALARFDVYRNNFIVLNGDALAEMYPSVQRLIGAQAFRLLATAYVRRHPPRERALLLYGAEFAEFLREIPELAALPYLPDVARLEYAWTAAYHAADATPITQAEVTRAGTETLASARLKPHPSLRLIDSRYPLYRIWQNNQHESDDLVSLDEGPSRVIVNRPGRQVEVREAGVGEFVLMRALHAGGSVQHALAQAIDTDPEFDLSDFFSRRLFDGTFVAINNKPKEE